MEKTCDIIKDLLPLYIDGVCSEDSKRAVEEHIEGCESCKRELESYKGEISAVDRQEEEVIKKISSRWKRSKTKALLTGILAMAVVIVFGISALLYSVTTRAVKDSEVTVEDLSMLSNSNVYFALKVSDAIHAKGVSWFEEKGDIYITLKTDKLRLKNTKTAENSFAENTDDYSRWEFDTKMSGIKNIYLYEGLKGYEDGKSAKTLIWSSGMNLSAAKTEAEVWIRTYHPWGNTEPGLLANTLYEHKNPYVGNMSANGRIVADLKVGRVLGNFKNELQTKKEPYGYTLLFEESIKDKEQDNFDSTMKKYAFCMLALIENLSEVSWKYTLIEDGKERAVTQSITKEEASKILGNNIKSYGASAADVQNLLYTVGIEQ
ncbi:DUF4825 domain-containing protein [Anaerocolumna xylanovorans]|uniref:Anti-sigma-W factor RsiW n=1 Tax=Anaerocolumna xylanovorans DSM 12503 TaxID=1121345 RepID=A0A1M7YL13_9FIRM|nr:DUF4825 domain-containing protein [Anaerocolumna xylanovorans]SHO53288.1 Putative zinc-finger [Anaerocolumna xylanovorans DSM 12503]